MPVQNAASAAVINQYTPILHRFKALCAKKAAKGLCNSTADLNKVLRFYIFAAIILRIDLFCHNDLSVLVEIHNYYSVESILFDFTI